MMKFVKKSEVVVEMVVREGSISGVAACDSGVEVSTDRADGGRDSCVRCIANLVPVTGLDT